MNRRILISGGEGNLNKQLRKCNENYVLHIPTQLEMDITKIDEVERVIKEFSPTHIIHTAAITRPMFIMVLKVIIKKLMVLTHLLVMGGLS